MNVGFVSLGCSKNLVDTENIVGLFEGSSFVYESDLKKCDIIVINTCGFILSAKEEAIDTILEIAEYKADRLKKLIVCGCFVERYYEECQKEFPEVDRFIRISDYPRLKEILEDLLKEEFHYSFGENRVLVNKTHLAYLKIAEGCNNRCAFCAIPLIRGNYRSYPMEEILKEARMCREKGVRELNVVAQDTTYYGRDTEHKAMLPVLLKELDQIGFDWIRLLYIYSDEITEELLQTMKECRSVLPYFDMPIQSGSDKTLRRMRRRDTVEGIRDAVELIRSYFPEAVFRTTIITGFPGESVEDFEETLALVKELRFDSLGGFTFSKEEGTLADTMEDDVPEEEKKRRYEELMETQRAIVDEKLASHIGKIYPVLIERREGLFHRAVGRSYLSAPDGIDGVVYVQNDDLETGQFYNVQITGQKDYDLIGQIIEEEHA
ncbi:MAG: 30S ribosomal protein S12 methylthiotransferase RimO [Erysipelotrichaceae bacterium]|nr:30S ribosomal protein S12 methylthiotransferase RimO [Erysipelotrichaceae bacterium]